MSYPTKPGDTFTAKVIGTWPELPDPAFDTKADNPQWYAEHEFPEDGSHVMRFGGPKGEVVVTLVDGVFTHAQPDGTVLRRSRWNAETMNWDVLEQTAAHDMYTHRNGRVCILVEDGTWFVPLDIGGEGYTCEMDHGPSTTREE